MAKIKVEYTLDTKCALDITVDNGGQKSVAWDATEDIARKRIDVAQDVFFEIIYGADVQPYLVLGANVPAGSELSVEGHFVRDGHLMAALGTGRGDEYRDPFAQEFTRAGNNLSFSVTA